MGLDGAGIATTSTRSIMAAVLMIYVMKSSHLKIYTSIKNYFSVDFKLIKKLLKIGLPSGFQYFLEVASFAYAAIMIGWLGANQLAAHQIAINLASATYMIILGISSAGMIRVASAVGRKDIKETRRSGFTAMIVAMSIMIFFGIMFIILKNVLPKFYIEDPQVIELASSLLLIAAIFQIFDGMQATAIGILRGIKDVNFPLVLSFMGYWIVGIGSAYIFGFILDMKAFGVWIGLAMALMAVGVTLTLRFNFKSRSVIED
jgi:MATE family multidrug resistance protein